MSKTSLRSRGSLRFSSKRGKKKEEEEKKDDLGLKPYDFCCSRDDYDPLTKYDQRNPPFKSSMTDITRPIDGSPSLKVRVEDTASKVMVPRKKGLKSKGGIQDGNFVVDSSCSPSHGPLLWYKEEELELAKDMVWHEKQKDAEEEANRNAAVGKKKVKAIVRKAKDLGAPRWYQDFSIKQIQNLMSLKDMMLADHEENVTGRTERALLAIGITSTFVKIVPATIRKLRLIAELNPIAFLCEIYRHLTGKYFEDEVYKKSYDCNEKIVLSAIAFLALPETIIELDKRMPPVKMPEFPPKPQLSEVRASRSRWKSPYQEPLWTTFDWTDYRNRLNQWRKRCKMIPIPKVILPPVKENLVVNEGTTMMKRQMDERRNHTIDDVENIDFRRINVGNQNCLEEPDEKQTLEKKTIANIDNKQKLSMDFEIPRLPGGSNQKFDFTISGLGGKPGPVQYKICSTLRSPLPRRKSWFGEKEAHYIISGVSEHEDPPACPVTYVMSGVAVVTPNNSNEDFFTELKLGDGPKKIYPAGRKNLSRKWQEWLADADEEFMKVEKEANRLIKSVEATMRLVMPGPSCDACCSCRQTRKADLKRHETKLPYMVIDSIAEDDDRNKYIVGSLAMHSPAPSPPESMVNLLEVVASRDDVSKKIIINGITNDSGETTYYISGIMQETEHVSHKNLSKSSSPKPLKNVPPCACTIQQIFNDGLSPRTSKDDVTKTKKDAKCIGTKYRSHEVPAYSCMESSGMFNKASPFVGTTKELKKLKKGKMMAERQEDGLKSYDVFTRQPYNDDDNKEKIKNAGGSWDDGKKKSRPPGVKLKQKKMATLNRDEFYHEKLGRKKIARAEEKQMMRDSECECQDQQNVLHTTLTIDKGGKDYEKFAKSTSRQQRISAVGENSRKRKREGGRVQNRKKRIVNTAKSEGGGRIPEGYEIFKKNVKGSRSHDESYVGKKRSKNSRAFVESVKNINFKSKNGGEDQDRIGRKDKKIRGFKNKISVNKTKTLDRDYSAKERDERRMIKSNDGKWSGQKEKLVKLSSYKEYKNDNVRKNDKNTEEEKKKEINVSKRDGKESETKEMKDKMKKTKKLSSLETNSTRKQTILGMANVTIQGQQKLLKHAEPVSAPEEPHRTSEKMNYNSEALQSDDLNITKEGPFGRKTKSQEELPPEKTLVYLVEPSYPIEMVPLRPGGRPCRCRENRNNKKQLLYGIGGIMNQGRGSKNQNPARVIEGVTYVTPTPSIRMSDEFVPEYELSESRHDICLRDRKEKNMKYVEEFLGPKSLMSNKPRNAESCRCGDDKETYEVNDDDYTEDEEKAGETKGNELKVKEGKEESTMNKETKDGSRSITSGINSKSPEFSTDHWAKAIEDENLVDFFVRCRDNVPCWLRCAKFTKDGCCTRPRRLQVKRPVCECKYERKLLRREEERKKWMERQQRLKSYKKQPFLHVAGTSRPIEPDTKLVISAVRRISGEDEYEDDVKYCISGVAENRSMGPAQCLLSGVTMHTPFVTPKPSEPDISCMCGHRHWSPMSVTVDGTLTGMERYPCRKEIKASEATTNCVNEGVCNENGCQLICDSCPSATFCDPSARQLLSNVKVKVPRAGLKGILSKREKMVKDTGGSKLRKRAERSSRMDKWFEAQDSPVQSAVKENSQEAPDASKAGLIKNVVKESRYGVTENKSKTHKSIVTNLTVRDKGDGDGKVERSNTWSNEKDLMKIMKLELEKMANEGFLLAKLPVSFMMPQLKTWIIYRKGVVYSEDYKRKILDNFTKKWNTLSSMTANYLKFAPISLHMTKKEIKYLTFDRAMEIKRKITMKKAIFFSKLRKRRVSKTRFMWNLLEFGRFPCMSFKQAFFTYLPSKEADGHVFRPWQIREVRKRK